MKELLLARSFIWSQSDHKIQTSYLISILGVVLGVTFLILTIGVYDSYVKKLEAIAFSVYPHVLVFDDGEKSTATDEEELTSSERSRV